MKHSNRTAKRGATRTVRLNPENVANLNALQKRIGTVKDWQQFVESFSNAAVGSLLGNPELTEEMLLEHLGFDKPAAGHVAPTPPPSPATKPTGGETSHAINLSTPELAALRWIGERNFPKMDTWPAWSMDYVAEHVLRICLAYPHEITRWIYSVADYRNAEGFEATSVSDMAIARARIAGRPEYQKHLRKLTK